MNDIPNDVLFRYERSGSWLRLTHKGMTNHEIREIICGMWARLDADDRVDHLAMLAHYERVLTGKEEGYLSSIAQAIKDGPEGESALDLLALQRRREGTDE